MDSVPNVLPVRLLGVRFFRTPSHHVASPRFEEYGELIVMLGGIYRAHLAGSRPADRLEAKAGDVLYWPARTKRIEENEPRQPAQCIVISVRWTSPEWALPQMIHDREGIIRILAQRLLLVTDQPGAYPRAVQNAYLSAIIAEHLRLAGLVADDLAMRVARYTEENIAMPFRLAELARHIGLDPHHFGRRYRQLTGITPMQFVRRRRAEYAMGMLLTHPGRPLKDIAPRVGVAEERQLRRLLKRFTGMTVRDMKSDRATRRNPPYLLPAEEKKRKRSPRLP